MGAGRTLVIGEVDKPRRAMHRNGPLVSLTGNNKRPAHMEHVNMVLLLTPRINTY
jgi:hypothetical protein